MSFPSEPYAWPILSPNNHAVWLPRENHKSHNPSVMREGRDWLLEPGAFLLVAWSERLLGFAGRRRGCAKQNISVSSRSASILTVYFPENTLFPILWLCCFVLSFWGKRLASLGVWAGA